MVLVGRPEGWRLFGRPRLSWDLQETIQGECTGLIRLRMRTGGRVL